MNIMVNGEADEIDGEMTITELLKVKNVKMPDMVSVEVNGTVLERKTYPDTVVREGDKLEFLYFMGGGATGGHV